MRFAYYQILVDKIKDMLQVNHYMIKIIQDKEKENRN